MKKMTVVVIAIALLALGAVYVTGQADKPADGKKGVGKRGMHKRFGKRGPGGRRGKRGAMVGHMFRKLDLTDAQKTQIQGIMKSSRESSKTLRTQSRELRKQLHEATENGQFNESQVQAIAQKQGDLHAKMIVEKQKAKAQMFAVLTSEQKAKLAEMKAAFKKKMEERKAKWAEKRSAGAN